ncbi:primase C-terminal domain-containing protein [Bacillus sp. 1P06AnD]|uniref:primase C-terminal domain-containing protein n=1 Tax=Bacillus sp. 1P06AnD TaxID=3132208 RepID=UPI0039A3346B
MTKPIHIPDILTFITQGQLVKYKPINSKAPIQKQIRYRNQQDISKYHKGVVFVSHSKKDLLMGRGHIITSYETLNSQYNSLSHWTPNVFRGGTYYDFSKRIIKGHTKDNLKEIGVFGIDIDSENVHPYDIFLACDEQALPRPNVLLKTPRGYQAFFVLETPFFIHKRDNFKSLRVAERIAQNIVAALSFSIPIDANCNPFGFFRIPTNDNILFFNDTAINTKRLIDWSVKFSDKEKGNRIYFISPAGTSLQPGHKKWYREIICNPSIQSGNYNASRNNALLTLALANYASDVEYETAYNELDQFNSNLDAPLSKREFERTLKSAYSGRYKGPNKRYIEGLLNAWGKNDINLENTVQCWYKFKKDRKDRIRSHYHEREEDILLTIKKLISPEKPFITGSLTQLSEMFNMAVSTFKEVIKKSKILIKQVKGQGRNACSMLSTKSMLWKHTILLKRRNGNETGLLAFLSLHDILIPSNEIVALLEEFDTVKLVNSRENFILHPLII